LLLLLLLLLAAHLMPAPPWCDGRLRAGRQRRMRGRAAWSACWGRMLLQVSAWRWPAAGHGFRLATCSSK
jgi:hypothetical protein